ncbi:LysR family transcriptional regulator substrate-binding protein [Streptomyces sp. NPDC056987]|uniref:LysR family transcriptional regulator substrate-binding protein n=1 Tax=Streptomyces sp. NPDC056987 TaxID=3345988 RepID=UPI00363C9424
MEAFAASSASFRRPVMQTWAPSLPNLWAIARPRPARAFLAEAKIATTASRRAITAARAANGELAGELVIAVHMGLGARQLPQALGQLRNRHPKLQVTLHEEPDPVDMERLVRQGTLDMVLVHRIPAGCTFDIHPLGEEAYVAVRPRPSPKASKNWPARYCPP